MSAQTFTATEQFCAAMAFVDGLCCALMPKRDGDIVIPPAPGYGLGADDTAFYCRQQIIRIEQEERSAFFRQCRSKLDASLARIASSDDITRYSIAAE
jgi:hypothetical protein